MAQKKFAPTVVSNVSVLMKSFLELSPIEWAIQNF